MRKINDETMATIARIQNGDNSNEAWNSLFEDCRALLYSVAGKWIRGESCWTQDDLVDEVFIELMDKINLINTKDSGKFAGFLKKMATNIIKQNHRSSIHYINGAEVTYISIDKTIEDGDCIVDRYRRTGDVSRRYCKNNVKKRLHEKIAGLPENYRTSITLLMEGTSYEDIAKTMNCSVQNAYNYTKRGRNALRESITGDRNLYEDLAEEYGIAI